MWVHARKLDSAERRGMFGELCSLDDLTDAEYDQCLKTVHEYYAKNPGERRTGDRVLLKPNMGPPNSLARALPLADYNGERGGEVFWWFHKVYFAKALKDLGTTVKLATEAQVMSALKTTSESLRGGQVNGMQLLKYAGPQCYPQVRDRMNAGLKPVSGDSGAKELNQWRDCWLCCSSCTKMRLVRKDCMPAVCPEMFKGEETCPGDVEWRNWMQMAEERFNAFAATQQPKEKEEAVVPSAVTVEAADLSELEREESAEAADDAKKAETVEEE